jgi:predicted nuclease of predicted toxin-antitoxin system
MSQADPSSWAFLIDEDMSRSLAIALQQAGYDAVDIRNVGLRGKSDPEVFAYAQTHHRILITEDLGFSNILLFPLGSHAGIIVCRFPSFLPTGQVNQAIIAGLATLHGQDLTGILIIIEQGKIRVRRKN